MKIFGRKKKMLKKKKEIQKWMSYRCVVVVGLSIDDILFFSEFGAYATIERGGREHIAGKHGARQQTASQLAIGSRLDEQSQAEMRLTPIVERHVAHELVVDALARGNLIVGELRFAQFHVLFDFGSVAVCAVGAVEKAHAVLQLCGRGVRAALQHAGARVRRMLMTMFVRGTTQHALLRRLRCVTSPSVRHFVVSCEPIEQHQTDVVGQRFQQSLVEQQTRVQLFVPPFFITDGVIIIAGVAFGLEFFRACQRG